MEAIRVEAPRRRRAEPRVVVHARRRVAIGGPSNGGPHLINPGLDLADLAELPGGDVVHGAAKMLRAAPLRADLQDALMLACRLPNELPLLNRLAERLLDESVLARLAGLHG